MSKHAVIFLLMYIAMTADTSKPRNTSNHSRNSVLHSIEPTERKIFQKDLPVNLPSNASQSLTNRGIPPHRNKKTGQRLKKLKKKNGGILMFRPYNFTVEKVSNDAIRIGWERNLRRHLGARTTFSIKVLPYKNKQYFEAHITDIMNNIVLYGLSPETQYNLVVTQNKDILLNKSLVVGEDATSSSPPRAQEGLAPNNSTLYYHPSPTNKVRVEEIVIVSFILVLWVCAISLFVHRWGKIRMLVPHQPPYSEVVPSDQTKVLVSGSRHNLSSLDPNHPNFTSVCSSSNYSTTAAAVKASGVGTSIGFTTHRPYNNSAASAPNNNPASILLACERARLWRSRARGRHRQHNSLNSAHPDNRQNSVLSENNAGHNEGFLRLRPANSRRAKSALDLRESFRNKQHPLGRSGQEPPFRSRQNSRRETGSHHFLKTDSEQTEDHPSTIVVISGVNSELKMCSVLGDSVGLRDAAGPVTKDTQV